jgi:hypothetical protein
MLLKFILQMRENPDLQEAFLTDPDGALAQRGLSEEERAILLCGDQKLIARAIAREIKRGGEVDLGAFSDEARQVLALGDEKRIAQHFARRPEMMAMMPSPTPGPWIYPDGGARAGRNITGIAPNFGRRGSTVTVFFYGSYFHDKYAGVELRHTAPDHRVPGVVGAVTGANQRRSSVPVTFKLGATIPTGVYKIFVHRAGEDWVQVGNIPFSVLAQQNIRAFSGKKQQRVA